MLGGYSLKSWTRCRCVNGTFAFKVSATALAASEIVKRQARVPSQLGTYQFLFTYLV